MNRSFAAPQRAMFRAARALQTPLGRPGGPVITAAPGAGGGPALALANGILAREAARQRAIDLEDPEPYDPSLENQMPAEDEEDDEEMARDDAGRFARQDEEEEPPLEDEPTQGQPPGRDVDITIVDVDEEIEAGPDDEPY